MDRASGYPVLTANVNNISSDSIDCGITKLGWCRGPWCQKYATLKWFVVVLSLAGILQGAALSYFRISAKQAAIAYGYDSVIVDWLLVSSGIFQAVLALSVAYWSHRFHPISWLGGITILQGVVTVLAIVPAVMTISSDDLASATYANTLCPSNASQLSRISLEVEQTRMGTLILLFVLQFFIGLGNLVFIVIGITYIDDNSQSLDSAAVIGVALCASITGFQFGYFITMIVTIAHGSWWLGWAILGPLILVAGTLLALFPRRLVKTLLHQTAQRIIEESSLRTFGSRMSAFIDDTNFFPTMKRLIKNRLLMCNIAGLMFILGAIFNYAAHEESYLRSRFYIPFSEEDGLMDEWNLRFVSYFLMPPCAGTAVLIAGLVISKLKLSARAITSMNIVLGLCLAGIFASLVFIKCDVGSIAGFSNGKLAQSFCSKDCICSSNTFLPVCPESGTVTYFSPCYAGCKTHSVINNIALYEGCTCGVNETMTRATEGACNQSNCKKMWILFQVASLSMSSILASTLIGKVIIIFRSVLPQDKPMALALKVQLVGIFTFLPVKFGYDMVSKRTCIYWTQNYAECLLRQTPLHGDILNMLTGGLILIGVLFDVLVFIFAKNLNVYNCKVRDPDYNADPTTEPSTMVPTTTLYVPIPNHEPSSPPETPSQPKPLKQLRPAPKPFVFRSPSSVTDSSVDTNQDSLSNGVTYSQVIFAKKSGTDPNDEDRLDFRRQTVRADEPTHHLSVNDVRTQLGSLKSFNPAPAPSASEPRAATPPPLDEARPKSPETDF